MGVSLPYTLTVIPEYNNFEFTVANISVHSTNNVTLKKLNLLMLLPNGMTDTVALGDKNSYIFPTDFKQVPRPIEGQYEVILYNASNNHNITSVTIDAAKSNILNSISHSIFGENALTAIAAISIPVAWIIKYLGGLYSEKKKKLDEAITQSKVRLERKLNWTQENMKYYFRIGSSSFNVCSKIAEIFGKKVEDMSTIDFDINKICINGEFKDTKKLESLLRRIIILDQNWREFNKSLGYYYFDDIKAETYVNNLLDETLNQSYRMFSDENKFVNFVQRYSKVTDPNYISPSLIKEFDCFAAELSKSLCTKGIEHTCSSLKPVCCNSPVECYYKNLLMLYCILDICVNKVAFVTYSSETAESEEQQKLAKYRIQLESHVKNTIPITFRGEKVDARTFWNQIFDEKK